MAVAPRLDALVENLLRASDDARPQRLRELLRAVVHAADQDMLEEAATSLRQAIVSTLDYTSAVAVYRVYNKLRPRLRSGPAALRIAVLGSFNTDALVQFIELFLFAANANVELYASDYGVFRQEILDPRSRLFEFRPNLVLLATSWRDIGNVPKPTPAQ